MKKIVANSEELGSLKCVASEEDEAGDFYQISVVEQFL